MRILAHLVVAACALGQQPAAFAELRFPAGVPASVEGLGKLVHVRDGAQLQVFSACQRSFRSWPLTSAATLHQTNDVLLIRDGAQWTAFSAYAGRFAPLAVSPMAVLVNVRSRTNDSVLLVHDGGLLHAFSGFTGRWVSRAMAPTAVVEVQRHVALFVDGPVLGGFDAYTGSWHDIVIAAPVTLLSSDGVCGIALAGGQVHGFSALRAGWAMAAELPGAALLRDDDWAVFHDGVQALGFSALTGVFAPAVTGPVTTVHREDLFAALAVADGVHAFSAITGTWSSIACGPAAVVRTNVASALVTDVAQAFAYSALRGQFAAVPIDVGSEAVAGCVVAVVEQGSGRPWLFSALTGSWHMAPIDALPMLPRVATTAALLATATGHSAFSARSGAFVSLPGGGTAESNESSAPIAVWDALALHVFDARRDRWRRAERSGTGPLQVQIWRSSLVAIDSGEVLGFGAQHGQLHRTPLLEPVVAFRANSESARITTATRLHAYAAVPEATSFVQFPDFRRVQTVGAPFRLQVRLLPGDSALLGYGMPLAVPLPLLGLGELGIDPAGLAVALLLAEADADRAWFEIQVPAIASLQGLMFALQALVVPSTGAAYLTDSAEVWLG